MPGNPKTSTVLAEATSLGAHKVAINHLEYKAKELVFSQGDRSDAVFFIERGKVKLTVVSRGGREAIIGFSGVNDFVGEQCMAGETSRAMSVTVVEDCSLLKIGRPHMPQILRQNPQLSFAFTSYLLSRNQRLYEELVDHFFNHSEKRLARILLSLANFGGASRVEGIFLRINQETLAEMVGTTRGRISFFMNKFRKEGFIEYKPNSGLYVRSALINVLLRE
jgi:CRP/FNR family transcriptional regulator, cyclic AMP receptor protein